MINRVGGPVHDFPSDIIPGPKSGLFVVIALGPDSPGLKSVGETDTTRIIIRTRIALIQAPTSHATCGI